LALRLNKFLAERGVGSRRRCDELISEGRVSINGRVVSELGVKVEEQRDRVTVDGKPVGGRENAVYYVLNKPVGVITTLEDPEGRRTVGQLLPRGARIYPVGRLDADTSGLLLLTNDGELAHRLMHPRYGVAKVYRVRLAREPRPEQLRRLATGVRFDRDQVSAPARARRIDPGFDAIMIEVIVREGRFRQVRKMCEAVGLEVTGLHRVGYGPIRLGPLARGMFRELSDEEVTRLKAESARAGGDGRGPGRPRTAASRPATRPGPERAAGKRRPASPDREPRTELPEEASWPARASGGRGDTAWQAEHPVADRTPGLPRNEVARSGATRSRAARSGVPRREDARNGAPRSRVARSGPPRREDARSGPARSGPARRTDARSGPTRNRAARSGPKRMEDARRGSKRAESRSRGPRGRQTAEKKRNPSRRNRS
jgi:23S rRNA pseudouridine2605 synthase